MSCPNHSGLSLAFFVFGFCFFFGKEEALYCLMVNICLDWGHRRFSSVWVFIMVWPLAHLLPISTTSLGVSPKWGIAIYQGCISKLNQRIYQAKLKLNHNKTRPFNTMGQEMSWNPLLFKDFNSNLHQLNKIYVLPYKAD